MVKVKVEMDRDDILRACIYWVQQEMPDVSITQEARLNVTPGYQTNDPREDGSPQVSATVEVPK